MSIGPLRFGAHHALPEFGVEFEVEFVPGGGFEDGGVADENIDPPWFVGYTLTHLVDAEWVADVKRCGNGGLAGPGDELAGLGQVLDAADDDGRSPLGEAEGDRLADAAGGSGDERDSPGARFVGICATHFNLFCVRRHVRICGPFGRPGADR